MAEFFKVLEATPLGEPYTPNFPDAKPIQNYWCKVKGEELAVSISKQQGNVVTPGEYIYGDLLRATSKKGTNYWKFKSSQVPEGVERPADEVVSQPSASPARTEKNMSAPGYEQLLNLMISMDKKIDKLLAGSTPTDKEFLETVGKAVNPKEPDNVPEDIDDKPLDLSEIPF